VTFAFKSKADIANHGIVSGLVRSYNGNGGSHAYAIRKTFVHLNRLRRRGGQRIVVRFCLRAEFANVIDD